MSNRSLTGGSIEVTMNATVQNTLEDGKVAKVTHPNLGYRLALSSGVETSQANRGWQSENRSLLGGASEVIDLYDLAGIDVGAGVGLDGVGQEMSLEEIVAIAVVNENLITAVGQLEIEADAANGWTRLGDHTAAAGSALWGQGLLIKCQPAGDSLDVTDAGNHRLKFTANGGAVDYSVYVLARHDDEASSSSSSTSSVSSVSSSSSTSTQSSSSSSSSTSTQSSSSTSTQSSSSQSSMSESSQSSVSSMSSSSWTTESASSVSSASSSSQSLSSTISSSSSRSSSSWTT